jgi:hypothetical protein
MVWWAPLQRSRRSSRGPSALQARRAIPEAHASSVLIIPEIVVVLIEIIDVVEVVLIFVVIVIIVVIVVIVVEVVFFLVVVFVVILVEVILVIVEVILVVVQLLVVERFVFLVIIAARSERESRRFVRVHFLTEPRGMKVNHQPSGLAD